MYILTSDDGRITAASRDTILTDGMTVDAPDGFDIEYCGDWRLENGALVYDPQEAEAAEQSTEELLLELAADHEYRICLMELGVTEDDL